MPNTTKNQTPLKITTHYNKNRNPLEKQRPIQNGTPITPTITDNPKLNWLKDENLLSLRTGKVNHIHTITILAVMTMHSTLLSLGTYLCLFCLPRRFPAPAAPAPACRPQELTGTSQPNARGTLLPPQPPEPQRGHTQPEVLAPQLASKAELPLTYAEDSQLLPEHQSVSPLT